MDGRDYIAYFTMEIGLLDAMPTYAGKAHPQDMQGKQVIRRIHQVQEALKGKIKLVYLEDYGIELAKLLTSGVDLWLNTPKPPLEASGTSGMKAAVNGVPSFSMHSGV